MKARRTSRDELVGGIFFSWPNKADAIGERKNAWSTNEWPDSMLQPQVLAARVRYVGSQEHKNYPSSAGEPGLRSDATPCDPAIKREQAEAVLQTAIHRRCVSEQREGDFPRYVWGRLHGRLYQARLINQQQGWYKAWAIEEIEAPRDRDGRLNATSWENVEDRDV
jgi:hypothetical protein